MASCSANPAATELSVEDTATRDAEAKVKYDQGVSMIKVCLTFPADTSFAHARSYPRKNIWAILKSKMFHAMK